MSCRHIISNRGFADYPATAPRKTSRLQRGTCILAAAGRANHYYGAKPGARAFRQRSVVVAAGSQGNWGRKIQAVTQVECGGLSAAGILSAQAEPQPGNYQLSCRYQKASSLAMTTPAVTKGLGKLGHRLSSSEFWSRGLRGNVAAATFC